MSSDGFDEGLGRLFDESVGGRYLDPTAIIDETRTLARLLSHTSNAKPSEDTNKKAARLMATFGTLGGVLNASDRLLQKEDVDFRTIELLRTVLVAQIHVLKAEITKDQPINCWEQLTDYLTTTMAYHKTEGLKVLFLDRKNCLIKDEVMSVGTVDHTPVYPREVVKRALELNASAIILAHNHPSGDPTPSQPDITMTQQIQDACSVLGLTVHDHVIVGHNRKCVSLRELGYL